MTRGLAGAIAAIALLLTTPALAQTSPGVDGNAVPGAPAVVAVTSTTTGKTIKVPTVAILCFDGTNYVACSGAGGGGSMPTGAAGTPNSNVVTVQGISGGTPLPLSTGAATSANQATLNSGIGTVGDAANAGTSGASLLAFNRSQAANLATIAAAAADTTTPSPVNLTQVAGAAFARGQATSAQSLPVVLASDGVMAPVTPVANSALANSLVLKTSAGLLYGVNVVSTNVSGYVMIFNATAAPADGTVAPLKCIPLTGQTPTGLQLSWRTAPLSMSTGITVVFSTTGCFIKTASATVYISGDVR